MMYTYLQSVHFRGIEQYLQSSQLSCLLRADMYTLCMCRLSFVIDPVRFFSFSFFFRNEFPQTRGFLDIRQS